MGVCVFELACPYAAHGCRHFQIYRLTCSNHSGLPIPKVVLQYQELLSTDQSIDLSAHAVRAFPFPKVVLQYQELRSGQNVTRVVTRRLPVVATVSEFVRCIDPTATAIVGCCSVVALVVACGGVRVCVCVCVCGGGDAREFVRCIMNPTSTATVSQY